MNDGALWSPSAPTDRDRALDEIDRRIAHLFVLVAEGLAQATAAFLCGDRVAAAKVAAADIVIDELHRGTEALVDHELSTVVDGIDRHGLRRLVLALRIMPELERSGDLVEHIAARASCVLLVQLPPPASGLIRQMSDVAGELWHRASDCFAGEAIFTGTAFRSLDDELDDLHVQLSSELADAAISVPAAIEMGLVARFYERLGDHAVNIAHRISST